MRSALTVLSRSSCPPHSSFDDAKAVAIVQDVLDAQAEQFGNSQTRCRQNCEQHLILTFRTLDDLTHLLVGERRAVLLLRVHSGHEQNIVVPCDRVKRLACGFVLGTGDDHFDDAEIVLDRLGSVAVLRQLCDTAQ